MKKFLFLLAFVSSFAFAEASFDQVQGLIAQQNYSAAAAGLETIIQNHPKSAKAFYSMAQAQAGLGNLEKANKALSIATGLDPTLSFASSSQVQSLREAITPQTKKIEAVDDTHVIRNTILIIMILALAYIVYTVYRRNKDAEEGSGYAGSSGPKNPGPDDDYHKASPSDQAYMREHNMAPKPKVYASATKSTTTTTASSNPAPVYVAPSSQPPTVVNNHYGSNNDGLVTGMILGNMMGNHHDHTTIIEKEVVREVPSKSYSSPVDTSWDNSNSKSSSWDDTPSRSSSWDSSSSSSSSSSWSSSSDSSSSWDSGSSSSSSDSSW